MDTACLDLDEANCVHLQLLLRDQSLAPLRILLSCFGRADYGAVTTDSSGQRANGSHDLMPAQVPCATKLS
jgi:hypothetical protein